MIGAYLALECLEESSSITAVAEVVPLPVRGHQKRCTIGQTVQDTKKREPVTVYTQEGELV
ncbi:MAG: hypothetical protein ACK56F_27825 [bacterium]